MADPDQARATQLRNIESKTGKSLAELRAAIAASGKVKHGEVRAWLIEAYGLGYGDANGLAQNAAKSATDAPGTDPLDAIYQGTKAHLRPVHDAVVAAARAFGDFEIAPKKAYVALRRKKQFAMIGPRNAQAAELGINLSDHIASPRVITQRPGSMCQYAIALTKPEDVDDEVIAVLRRAYEAAG